MTFGKIDGFPRMFVLDSTDPAQVKALEDKVDLANTVFIVSSKSGTTLEPNIFKQYFFERVEQTLGAGKAGSRFIAITDPGSKFEQVAQADGFRHIFHGVPSIGGRYSALSDFGMVPAAVMGIDALRFLDRADVMAIACSSCLPVDKNPGVQLGLMLGVAAKSGRDKVTLITSPGIWDFGAWLEQLLAESTGKEGKGLIPVDREALGAPEVYGNDRVFAYIRLENGADPAQDKAVEALAKAGHPVVRIALSDIYNLGQEMFRWEIATAVAGSVIGINAFNQPDVEASKIETRKLTDGIRKERARCRPNRPFFPRTASTCSPTKRTPRRWTRPRARTKRWLGYLRAHLNRLKAGDYFALLGYVEMNEAHEKTLQSMRIERARQEARRDVPGVRPALPAFDRPGL